MAIVRIQKTENYVVLDKEIFSDASLSWKAKGLYAYMMSKPNDWTFYNKELEKRSTDGRESLKAGMDELKKAGYIERVRKQDENGHFVGWETIVHEKPINRNTGNPSIGKTESRENRKSDNPQLLSNECTNYELTKNELIDIVVSYLNKKAEKNFRSNAKKTKNLINARIEEGFSVEDFQSVIDNKVSQWKGDPKMDKYLRPETLFSTKFESYLNEKQFGIASKDDQLKALFEYAERTDSYGEERSRFTS